MVLVDSLCVLLTGLLLCGEQPGTATVSRASAIQPGQRHFVVQLRIIEVDPDGQRTIIAQPILQTTGTATGVTVEADNGRQFEFHFAAADAPPEPLATAGHGVPPGNAGPMPIAALKPVAKLSPTPRVTVKAVQKPRKDVLRDVARQAGMIVAMETDVADAVASQLAMPINLELTDAPIDVVLRQLVDPLSLPFSVRDDVVLIGHGVPADAAAVPIELPPPLQMEPAPRTALQPMNLPPLTLRQPDNTPRLANTPLPAPVPQPNTPPQPDADAPDDWQIRVYGVADLVTTEANPFDVEPLMQQLQKQVEPESWALSGGMGTIRGFGSTKSLVIRQTSRGHAAVKSYLEQRRQQAAQPPE